MIILGKNVTVRIYDGGWKLYLCARSCSLSVTTTTVETSTTGSGLWATFKPQKHGWGGTLEGAINLDGDGLSLYDLRQKQIAMTELNIQYERVDEAGNYYLDEGIAIITNSSDTGSVGDIATFTIDILGTGALVQNIGAAPSGTFDDTFDDTFN